MDAGKDAADAAYARFRSSGDPAALGDVYDALAPELLRVAMHLTHDAAQAEDALQATFVAAIERAESFDAERRVMPWLAGILANEARRARARARRELDPQRLATAAASTPAQDAERAELVERLEREVGRLPEAFRPVLILRIRHGLSATEIADALGRPSGTVRSQLARGIEDLRRALPAGLAGALLVAGLAPTRGLAGVREAILAHAAAVPAAVSLGAAIGGALAVKKLLVAALIVAALAATFWSIRTQSPPPAEAPQAQASPSTASSAELAAAAPIAQPALEDEQRAPVAAPAPAEPVAAPSARGSLVVLALAAGSAAPVAGEVVLLRTEEYGMRIDDALVARTDAQGRARFADLAPGRANVQLLRGGEDRITLAAGVERELTLHVHAGVEVAGTVVDAGGAAVADADVWLSERYRTNLGHVVARTGRDGRFRVDSIGPDSFLAARAAGYASSGLRSVRGMPGETVTLELVLDAPGVEVRGRVVDSDGRPVAGAQLLIGEETPALGERLDDGTFGFSAPPLRATSAADGAFRVAGVRAGLVRVQARAAGFGPYDGEREIVAGARNEIELVLPPQASVAGIVRDGAGRALVAVRVQSGAVELFGSRWTHSGLDGRFALADVAPGKTRLSAQHATLGSVEIEPLLAAGETFEWNPVLAGRPRLFGTVVDAAGAPLAGWTVLAFPQGSRETNVHSLPTGADGGFELAEVGEGALELWVQPPAGWREFPALIVTDASAADSPLRLEVPDPSLAAGSLRARVVGPDGAPVTGAELQLWHEDRSLWRTFTIDGKTGEIEVPGVPPGRCHVEVRHPDHPWIRAGARVVAAGERTDLGTLRFADSGRLRCRVTGIPPERIAQLQLMISAANQESGVVRYVEGELRSGPLAGGRHMLTVHGDRVVMHTQEVDIREGAETFVELRLVPCALRRVVFELPGGMARPRWLACTAFGADGKVIWNGSAGGEAELAIAVSAPPGHYRLAASGDGGVAADGSFDITGSAADAEPARIALSPGK